MTFAGPAVVEDPGTTIVIHPGNQVAVDGYRNIRITIEK
jgi:N-methylhydantoinase A